MKKEIGIIGLGKMGGNMARRLVEKGWTIHGYDPIESTREKLASEGVKTAIDLSAFIAALPSPRIVWLMVSPRALTEGAPKPIDEALFGTDGLIKYLSKGDIVVDGGNSYFKETVARAEKLAAQGIELIDVGFSGGPSGARNGGCLMIGGKENIFRQLEELFRDVARDDGYRFFAGFGAGHFVKMVHNGIEYGMMQAIGEGFGIMRESEYKLDLKQVADIYNRGSVVESRLIGWLRSAFEQHGTDLAEVSGTVGHLGEGEWTVKTAEEMNIGVPVIKDSFQFRLDSEKSPSYIGKVVSALREQFGGPRTKNS